MSLILRETKGSKLTIPELDGNFTYLDQKAGNIPISNTVYVNTDLTTDIAGERIFKNYTNAIAWVSENGNASISNLWQIVLPAGNVGNVIISEPFIRISCNKNTVIENLSSSIEYSVINSLYCTLYNAQINKIDITDSDYISIQYCTIVDISAAEGETGYLNASDCLFIGGNFARVTCPTNYINCRFVGFYNPITNMSAAFDGCYFNNCEFDVDAVESFGLTNSNFESNCTFTNSTDVVKTLQLNACNYGNTISLSNKIKLDANFTNLGTLIFADATCTASLTDSTVATISGSGCVDCYGFSKYCKKVGDITYTDLNTSESMVMHISFSNAIPTNQYIDEMYWVFDEEFQKSALPPSSVGFASIMQYREETVLNQYGTVIVGSYNGKSTNQQDIITRIEFTGTNPINWVSGSMSVYAAFKNIPTAVFSHRT